MMSLWSQLILVSPPLLPLGAAIRPGIGNLLSPLEFLSRCAPQVFRKLPFEAAYHPPRVPGAVPGLPILTLT
jgi:hypothetical protein